MNDRAEESAVATATAPETKPESKASGGDLGVRIVGAVWALIFAAAFAVIVVSAFKSDFGTTNARLKLVIRASIFLLLYPAALGAVAG
jgi:hypothetical protein